MIIVTAFSFILAMFLAGYSDFYSNIPFFLCSWILCMIFAFDRKKSFLNNTLMLFTCTVIFVFGISFHTYAKNSINRSADEFISKSGETITGTVCSDITAYSSSSEFYIKSVSGDIIKIKYKSIKDIFPGDIVKIEKTQLFKITADNQLKNFNRQLLGNKCMLFSNVNADNLTVIGSDKYSKFLRFAYKLKKNTFYELLKYLKYDEAATAYAMFTSDKAFLTEEINNWFIKTGTIHMATVSGIHFALLAGLVLTSLRLVCASYRKRIVILIIIMTLFAFYTGMSVPVMRAYAVFAVKYITDFLRIKRIRQTELILVIMSGFLIFSPMYVYDISFILTFAAAIGIVFFSVPAERAYYKNSKGSFRLPIGSVIVTLVMLPFIFSIFGRISLVSVLANYCIDFVSGAALFFTGLTAVFSSFFTPAAYIFSFFLKIIMKYFLKVISVFSVIENINPQIPLGLISAIFLLIFIIALIYTILFRGRGAVKNISIALCSLICFIWCFTVPLFSERAYITFFGHDNCESVVISKNSHHIVIGTVNDFYYYSVSSALRNNEPIDLWIITDKIDYEKAEEIADNYNIKEIIAAEVYEEQNDVNGIKYYSDEEIGRTVKDLNLEIKFEYGRLLYTLIKYGDEKVYISKSGDFISDYLSDTKDCSIILNTSDKRAYKSLLEYIDIPGSVSIFSSALYDIDYNLLSPYCIGILEKEGINFY